MKFHGLSAGAAAFALFAAPASAATLTEDFEAPFPAWEAGWFGMNSNAENCYGAGAGRGNNPDGLWISTTGQGCDAGPVNVMFDNAFATTLLAFSLDVAGHSPTTLTFFDAAGNTLTSTPVTLTNGATSDPGIYVRYGVISTTGIGGFSFSGGAAGNTGIDNLIAETGMAGVVPEPSTWALLILGFGAVGGALRSKKRLAVRYA